MFSLSYTLTVQSQGFLHLGPVKIFVTSNDDVGPSMIVVLGLQRSKTHMKPIIKTVGTKSILSMSPIPMGGPEARGIQAMEGLHSSLTDQNRLAQTRVAQEHQPTSKDYANGLAGSVTFSDAMENIHS